MSKTTLQEVQTPATQPERNQQIRSDAISTSTPPYIAELTTSLELNQAIANLAYAHWEARGRPEGSPEEDWFLAEQELQFMRLAVNAG